MQKAKFKAFDEEWKKIDQDAVNFFFFVFYFSPSKRLYFDLMRATIRELKLIWGKGGFAVIRLTSEVKMTANIK